MLTPIMSNVYDNNPYQYYYAYPAYPIQQFQQPYNPDTMNNIAMQPETYNPYLIASHDPEVSNPIHDQPDHQISVPKQRKVKSTSKQKRQNITMTPEEQKILKERASAAKMTVSGYVVKQCVYGQYGTGCDRAADLAQHLSAMSNAVNALEDSEVKKIIEKEILALWRILR